MAKKRGLAANRGLDALLGSIKKEKLIAGLATPNAEAVATVDDEADDVSSVAIQAKQTKAVTAKKSDTIAQQATSAQVRSNDIIADEKPKNSAKSTQNKTIATSNADNYSSDIELSSDKLQYNLLHIAVNRLQRGKYQPRIELGEEALQELASSIKQHGVMQPIVIRPLNQPVGEVTHEIIAGERRWRAAQIAGLDHIPAIIRPMSDDLAIALALIENIQREDLSVMEQAVALQRFHDEFGMSHAQIADVVGKARTTVSNLLRLNQLHEDVKTALNDGQLDMGHARALLSLSAGQQPMIARKIVNEQLTVRQTEQLVKQILNPQLEEKPIKELDYERLRLNQQLSERLGAVVKVKGTSGGKGSIEIFFHTPEELQALLAQLQD